MVTFHVRQRRTLVGFHLRQCAAQTGFAGANYPASITTAVVRQLPESSNCRWPQLHRRLANSVLCHAAGVLVLNGLRWLFPGLNWTATGIWLIPLDVLIGVLGPVAVILQTSFRWGTIRRPRCGERFFGGFSPYVRSRCVSCGFSVDNTGRHYLP